MPKEYLACVASVKKSGKSLADARRICAIAFHKRHGKTPQQAAGETDMATVRDSLESQIRAAVERGDEEGAAGLRVLMEQDEGMATRQPAEAQQIAEAVWANIPYSYEFVQEKLRGALRDNAKLFGVTDEKDEWQVEIGATFAETAIVRGPDEKYFEVKWSLNRDGSAVTLSDVKPVTLDLKVTKTAQPGTTETLQEVYAQIDGSYEATMRDLRTAVRANYQLFGASEEWDARLEATFADRVIVNGGDSKLYRATWKRAEDDAITLADVVPVKVQLKVEDGETIRTAPPAGDGEAMLAGEAPAQAETADLLETYTAPVRVLAEKDTTTSAGSTDHLMAVECLLGIADSPTNNGRVYTKGLFEAIVAESKQGTARSKRWLGEGDHPVDGRPRLMDTICTPWRNLRLDGTRLLGETDIIDTSKGADVQKLVRSGVPVQVSSRTSAILTTEVRDGKTVDVVDERTALANLGGWDFVQGAAAHEGDEYAGVRSFREKDGQPAAAASTPSSSDVPGETIDEVIDEMTKEELEKLIQEAVAKGTTAGVQVLMESKEDPPAGDGDPPKKDGEEPEPTTETQDPDKLSDLSGRVDSLAEVVTKFVTGQEEAKQAEATTAALKLARTAIMETDEVTKWPDPARKLMEQALGEVTKVDQLQPIYERTERSLQEVGLLVLSRPGGVGMTAAHVASTPEKSKEDRAKELQLGVLPERFLPETKEEFLDLLCEGLPDNGLRSSSDPDDPIAQLLSSGLPFPGYHPENPVHHFRTVVENTIRAHPEYLMSNLREGRPRFRQLTEWTAVAGVAQTVPYVLPIIRQVWMRLLAMNLCSVQPMTKSTGAVHFLDFLYDPSGGDPSIPGQFVSDYGNNVSEQAAIPEVKLQVVKDDVTMDTKKLKAEWSSEVRQNLRADHGIEIAAEMMNFMANEIAREVNALLLNVLRTVADRTGAVTAGNVNFGCLLPAAGYTELSSWQPELYRHLLQADGLVRAQRRGRTNWMVAGQNALIRLMRLENWSMTTTDPEAADWDVGINRVGTLDGQPKYQVYSADADIWPTEEIMVGRKGPQWFDAGMVFCPFIPMYTAPLFVDGNTFCEREAVMSRFGYAKVVGNTLATVTCQPAGAGVGW